MEYIEYLKSNNLLLSSVINLIDDLIFYKDKDLKYIGCNTAFLNFINKSAEDLIGKDDFEIFDYDLAKLFRYNDKLMLAQGKVRTNEEFIILSESKNKIDTIKLAEKLRITVANKTLMSDINITISLGICEVIKGDCANSIAKRVDTLLYQAKSSGKNRVIHNSVA